MLHSPHRWLTGWGRYMPRWMCLDGDLFWGWAVIIGSAAVLGYYLLISRSFWRSYRAEAAADRLPALAWLMAIFLLCGVTGYGLSILMFWYPAYRLVGLALWGLAGVSGYYYHAHSASIALALRAPALLRERDAAVARAEAAADDLQGALHRKRALLRTLHAGLQHVLDRSEDDAGVAIVGAEDALPYLAVSERWLEMFGLDLTVGEVIGRSHHAEVFPGLYEQKPSWRRDHDRARAGERLSGSEEFADGPLTWAIEPLWDVDHREVVALVMVCERAHGRAAQDSVEQAALPWLSLRQSIHDALAAGWLRIRERMQMLEVGDEE